MKRYRVLPYRQGSKGAKALATALGGKVLKLEGSKFVLRNSDVIINWGNTDMGVSCVTASAMNCPAILRAATNKKQFFLTMTEKDCNDIIPRYWTSRTEIPDDAFPIVCRTVLAGHSGDGIVIANTPEELVQAPLYVQYVKKQDEYRIHVGAKPFQDSPVPPHGFTGVELVVIAKQRKARRHDVENPNWQVRNHQNGFIYAREGVNPPEAVTEAAKRALRATGLDFGAVDVLWNAKEMKAYVLEINTAPGLEGQTVTDYATFFRGIS